MRILRLLLQGEAFSPLNPDFRGSYRAIAEKVRADEDTVRYRLKKLHESGFLGDWRLQLNPRIWGGGQAVVFIDVNPHTRKDKLVDELKLLPGTMILNSFYERLGVVLEYDDEPSLRRQVELARRLSGARDAMVGRIPFPPCDTDLSARDWDLIRSLRKNPRKSYAALAAETGMSVRTIRRRLSRVVREGVAFAWPTLDPRGAGSGVLACLSVSCPIDRAGGIDETIGAHLNDSIWHVVHMLPSSPGDLVPTSYNLALPHILMARDILNWAGEVPGVREARLDMHEDIFTNFQSYDEYLDGKLRGMPTSSPTVTMTAARRPIKVAKRRRGKPRRPAVNRAVSWSGS